MELFLLSFPCIIISPWEQMEAVFISWDDSYVEHGFHSPR